MKALRKLENGDGHIDLVDVPDPVAIPDHVVLRVKAAGICGTDIHIVHDEFPTIPPVTLGHEVAGEIVGIGKNVENRHLGDPVVTETYYATCGICRWCHTGYPNLCASRKSIGSAVDGGFAEYIMVPERNLHRMPNGVSWSAGALTEPLACNVHALRSAPLHPGEWVVISGPGPMGLLATQLILAAGCRVIVVGLRQDAMRLQAARNIGAVTVSIADHDTIAATTDNIMDLTHGGAAVVAECAGVQNSTHLLANVVRNRGHYAQIGLHGRPVMVPWDLICYKELTVTGTNATVPAVWPEALNLLELGMVVPDHVVSDVLPLVEWQNAFKKVQAQDALKVILSP